MLKEQILKDNYNPIFWITHVKAIRHQSMRVTKRRMLKVDMQSHNKRLNWKRGYLD